MRLLYALSLPFRRDQAFLPDDGGHLPLEGSQYNETLIYFLLNGAVDNSFRNILGNCVVDVKDELNELLAKLSREPFHYCFLILDTFNLAPAFSLSSGGSTDLPPVEAQFRLRVDRIGRPSVEAGFGCRVASILDREV
jgi:hypothetical protein